MTVDGDNPKALPQFAAVGLFKKVNVMNDEKRHIYHASRQDLLLITSALLAYVSGSLTIWIYLAALIIIATILRKKAQESNYNPPEIDLSEAPKRTHFILMDKNDYGHLNWYFQPRKMQYFTWSFYFINIIFCPNHKTPDRHGFRRLQLIHEFAHCGRGELLLFLLAILAAFQMIISSINSVSFHYNVNNLYYFNVVLVFFGLYILWTAARIIRRREFIADHIAYKKSGKQYLDYLKFRSDDDQSSIVKTTNKRLMRSFIDNIKWHPTWHERAQFIENHRISTTQKTITLTSTAFLTALIAMQVTQTMMLPRQTFLTALLFGENPSYFMQPYGFIMHFVMIIWLCWLMGYAVKEFRFIIQILLIAAYSIGAAAAQFLFMYMEHINFNNSTYNIWYFIYPWGASGVWIAVSLTLLTIPVFRRIPTWVFAIYSNIGYLLGFAAFTSLVNLYLENDLPSTNPYFPFVMAIAFLLLSFIIIILLEITRQTSMWITRRIWSPHRPVS